MKTLMTVFGVVLLATFYLFTASQAAEKKLTASDAQADDLFGYTVSISGEYAIVGAYLEDTEGSDAGAAYIFYRNQGGTDNWGQVKKLTAADAEAGDHFGHRVAINGDYAIVGAWREDTGGSDAGAAYIFYRDKDGEDNWGEVKKLTASDAEAGDYFGYFLSISGDYVIVGAYQELNGNGGIGAAYIFYRNQGGTDNWGQVKKLTASDAQAGDWFGISVSISGDYAIVGANKEDAGGANAGAAYIFYRNQGEADNWGEVKKLTASDAEAGDGFGWRVSISGDYALIGSSLEDTRGENAGAAYIFDRNQGGANNWGQVTKLTASDAQADDNFGVFVSISGDYALVGAYFEDAGGSDAGAAYSFLRSGASWSEKVKITASDAQAGDNFGISVCIDDDYAIVGAFYEDGGSGDPIYRAGAAYIYNCVADLGVPVELTSFTACANANTVTLNWSTASETENLGYHIFRSLTEDGDYSKISADIIKGVGSSDQAHRYSYTDQNVKAGNTYYYKLADVNFNGNISFHGPISVTVEAVTPTKYVLEQCYPNPFNPETAINFSIKEAGKVSLKIYNLQGQLIRSLVDEDKLAGSYSIIWNGTDDQGIRVSSGTYLYKLKVNGFEDTKKLTVMR